MTHTPVEIIDHVTSLIQKGWCKEAYALNAQGMEVSFEDPNATCFCLSGALWRAETDLKAFGPASILVRDTVEIVARGVCGYGITMFNDTKEVSKEDVLRVLQEARQLLTPQQHT